MLKARSLKALMSCEDNQEVTQTQFCKVKEEYPPSTFTIHPTIQIFDVAEIDEDKKTITVFFQLYLSWNDTTTKLKLAASDDYQKTSTPGELWYNLQKLDKAKMNSILTYKQNSVEVINHQSARKVHITGGESFNYFWHKEPHYKIYGERLKETFSCDFDFKMFPFDKHRCYLRFFSPYFTDIILKFAPTKVYVNSSSTNLTEPSLLVQTNRLPYLITVESVPTGLHFHTEYTKATSGIVFNLERNDIGQLIGGFFWPTGIFTIISLVSFLIDPDVVPGRMGLLLSVFLIITNNYNSVNAPADRGFSFIEIWMVGIYLQILFAIFEYSYLIVQNRNKVMATYQNGEEVNIKKLSKRLDQNSIIFSLIYFIVFQCTYWLIVIFYVWTYRTYKTIFDPPFEA